MYVYKKLKSDFFSEGMGYIYFEGAIKKVWLHHLHVINTTSDDNANATHGEVFRLLLEDEVYLRASFFKTSLSWCLRWP